MHPKDAAGMANSVDPDQTAPSVCPDLSIRIITVHWARKQVVEGQIL